MRNKNTSYEQFTLYFPIVQIIPYEMYDRITAKPCLDISIKLTNDTNHKIQSI